MSGTLFVVATPIGHLGDLTLRAIETLKACDVVACEDTRRTEKLMRHLDVRKPLFRYDEHTHASGTRQILTHLQNGKAVALVTDAGTPAISDPGSRLVQEVLKAGFPVVPIPGASSLTAALSVSGMSDKGFVFLGFLPRKPGKAKRVLREGLGLGKTVVVLESPYRVNATLRLVKEIEPGADVMAAREMTKIHEEFIRGNVEKVLQQIERKPAQGEFVLLIAPPNLPRNTPETE